LQSSGIVSHCGKRKIEICIEIYPACGKERRPREIRNRRFRKLLQRTAQVVDSIVGMARIDDLKDHVVAGFQLAHHGIELILGAGGLLVDADVITRPGSSPCRSAKEPERTDWMTTPGCAAWRRWRERLADHDAQLGLAGVALVVRAGLGCWLPRSAKTLSRSPMVTVVSACLPSRR
jgi:hypothetical protein